MNGATTQTRYRAISMEIAAYLDERCVEMHVVTDNGETIAIACDKDSIFAVQRHIQQIGRDCPEIATWTTAGANENLRESDQSSYDAAVSEGWPARPGGA